MENKINIAELLKDCPKGMELYSTIYGTVYFEGVRDTGNAVLIDVKTSCNTEAQFYPDGKFNTYYSDSEMTLFPSKDVRTWEGFIPPCEFKDGDIIFTHANCLKVGVGNTWISIFQEKRNSGVATYVDYAEDGSDIYLYNEDKALLCMEKDILRQRLATEEEKQKLFDAINANGYRWNSKAKTLEKLIEPKFKVGDKIQHKNGYSLDVSILKINADCYTVKDFMGDQITIDFTHQDNYELVPNKFNINTLVPFESRVLVWNSKDQYWIPAFWGYKVKDGYVTTFGHCNYCIPFEGNEHLLGTTGNCSEFYKTWE